MPTKRPTGYYDVKQSAGEKGKTGKGVKKSNAQNVAKQTKSLKKKETLDCRKRGNKTLKECVERALKKAKEKRDREKSGSRYAKSRKGVKQPKNRKKPKKHTTKSGVTRGGLPIATQGFRDDRIAGRGQPQQQVQASQPQGVNMGFGSPFGVGAVYNQLQSSQVREREAQSQRKGEVARIFNQKNALSQRIEAQDTTITHQRTQLDILRSRFDSGELRGDPRSTRGGRTKGGTQSVGFASELGEGSIGGRGGTQSVNDLEDAKVDSVFAQDFRAETVALQIKALELRRGLARARSSQSDDYDRDSPSPRQVNALNKLELSGAITKEQKQKALGSPYLAGGSSAGTPRENPFDFGEEGTTRHGEGGRPPSPSSLTRQDLDQLVPFTTEDEVKEAQETAGGKSDLTDAQTEDLNKYVKRFNLTTGKSKTKHTIDYSYGGSKLQDQEEALNDLEIPYYALTTERTDRGEVVSVGGGGDQKEVYSGDGKEWKGFRSIEGHEHMLAPLVRPVGQKLEGQLTGGIRGDNYFGYKLGKESASKRIPKGTIEVPAGDDWQPPPARWEQVELDAGRVVGHTEYTDPDQFDNATGFPLLKGRQITPPSQFGRFVSNFGDKEDRPVVWQPFTQTWEDRPKKFAGVYARPREIYTSSLVQEELEGMPQPFVNQMSSGARGFHQFSIAEEDGKQNFINLAERGKGGKGEVEEVPIDVVDGTVVERDNE